MTTNSFRTLLLIASLVIFSTGCVKTYTIPKEATRDSIFVGKWEGQHFNKEGGYWRKWEQTRIVDGTYKLVLIYYDKNDRFLDSELEKGDWWIYDGLYYEISTSRMNEPEAYKYEILSEDQIKFLSVKIDSSSDEKVGYSFIDTRSKE